jgi:hypothetical protein
MPGGRKVGDDSWKEGAVRMGVGKKVLGILTFSLNHPGYI